MAEAFYSQVYEAMIVAMRSPYAREWSRNGASHLPAHGGGTDGEVLLKDPGVLEKDPGVLVSSRR